jgi:diaminohydroxyphosphoribosylaminopyrimidine deaminase/5-amino-6-(5-phosphoribosylamino)uracil reductase
MGIALERGARRSPVAQPARRRGRREERRRRIGAGHHERAGEEHAEVARAEGEAGSEQGQGGTLYVTLEPCNHVGRTPPCTDAPSRGEGRPRRRRLPRPEPARRGRRHREAARGGVASTSACREAEAQRLIAPWSKFVTTGLPYVSLKLALSLDGRIASRTGASKWVTGPEARARVHALRAQHDAVVIGIGTALADDPRLTVRDAPGTSPLRVVFDTKLRLPPHSRLVQTARERPDLGPLHDRRPASSNEEALVERGVEVLRAPSSAEGRIDPVGGAEDARRRGIVTVMVEGGAELAGSILAGAVVRRAPLLHRAHPARPARPPRRGRLGRPRHPAEAPRASRSPAGSSAERRHVWGSLSSPPRAEGAEASGEASLARMAIAGITLGMT